MSILGRAAFTAGQLSRSLWFGAQYGLAQRLAPPLEAPVPKPGSLPGWPAIFKDLRALQQQDWDNVEAGYYPPPADLIPSPRKAIGNAVRFVRDLPAVNLRRRLGSHKDVPKERLKGRRPRYYLQNFHYQSDGWLSEGSARLYDHQVEVLFTGGADAMRRQALVPLGNWIRTKSGTRNATLLDVACGTGRFLQDLKRAFPDVQATGLDMSEPYLKRARRALRGGRADTTAILGNAEVLPFATDAGPDLITSIFLLHELPAAVRVAAVREMARVLQPGGRLVLVDSIILGDHAPHDALLDRFPFAFHEPYYRDYIRDDCEAHAIAAGLAHAGTKRAFFARVMSFDKPGR